jgi:hypothetical protein
MGGDVGDERGRRCRDALSRSVRPSRAARECNRV